MGGESVAKMSYRHKFMAYILNKEFEYRQTDIAKLMNVSQSTIATCIKEITYRLQFEDLKKDLEDARKILQNQNLKPEPPQLNIESLKK